jgi:hypothetical protein
MGVLAAGFLIGLEYYKLSVGDGDAMADGESTFVCEAVPRVVVRRASPPRIFPPRAAWTRGLNPPLTRVVVPLASLPFSF